MAAAVPLIGSIIVGFLVSKVVVAIGEKIGLSDSLTNILAVGASIYAGGMTYQAASASQVGATQGATTGASANTIPGTTVAPSSVSNIPGTPLAPAGSPYASTPSAGFGQAAPRGGMLTEPSTIAANLSAPPASSSQVAAGGDTAGGIIDASTQSSTLAGNKSLLDTSWVDRLFSPEKTVDLIMAGMQGYGQAGIAKEQLEYPEEVKEKNAAGWAAAYPGMLSLDAPQFPSQVGG